MITFKEIEAALASHACVPLAAPSHTPAAVALILRRTASGMEVLFIERATRHGDPWSGDLGFPGGKMEACDGNERLAAERETREEIGLDLASARFLGRLADIAGAHLPVKVSCFVYGLVAPVSFMLDDEISSLFWVPLQTLCDPQRHVEASVRFGGKTMIRPAIRVLDPGKTVLWGITFRLVSDFLRIIGYPVNPPSPVGETLPCDPGQA